MGEYGIGQSVPRLEDARLLTGRGRYVDDGTLPNQALGYVLRSPHAHARVVRIDTAAAKTAPGVVAVLTAADYRADGLTPLPHVGPPVKRRDGQPVHIPPHWPLALDRARYVGEGVAFVVAETLAQAKDAAELIEVEYETLPAVTATEKAIGGPALYDAVPDNESFVYPVGDKAKTEQAIAGAARVIRARMTVSRVLGNAMEVRGCLAEYDARSEKYIVYAPVQHPYVVRRILSQTILKVPETQIRVVVDDVGGSFGIKANLFPEYLLCIWAAKRLGRPVKWLSERSEGHVSDYHGRDNVCDAALALDANGRFLALQIKLLVNIGAYFSPLGSGPATNNLGTLAGVYATPVAYVESVGVLSNTHPTAPYRGAGRPEAAYIIERLVDKAARELGVDGAELRRRNMIPPSAMPFKTAVTFTYDSGDFEAAQAAALTLIDRPGFETRRAASKSRGKLRGLGIAYAIERAAPPGLEYAELRFDATGTATILSGTTQQGQGHVTTYIQVLCERLGIAPDKVRVYEGDTDKIAFGFGAGGSRCSSMGTAAIMIAADKVIAKGKKIAAHALEAAESDIAFAEGTFRIAGTDRSLPLAEMVKIAYDPARLPKDVEGGLYESGTYRGDIACYPNGCHACEIEIDEDTGAVQVLRYVVVDDFGVVINPLLVKGQVHGGVAQGLGQALMENFVYDASSGQVLSGSFMDYCMPRADDMSSFEIETRPTPTTTNPLGVKGAGEAGTVGALPVVMNAVIDALAPLGVRHLDMPASPERVWRAIREAKAARA
jgi:carbon-monoxide dehydrogenase large subunit